MKTINKKQQRKWGIFPKGRRAQMQMMETIGVIFIFFVLVLFGSIFYFKFQEISFQNQQEELLAQKAMDITLVTLFLPEIQCSQGDAESEDNCVDMTKVRAMNMMMEENPRYLTDYYFNIFGYANISVNMVYPINYSWTVYEFEKTGIYDNGTEYSAWDRKEATYFVITLRDGMQGYGYDSAVSSLFLGNEIIYSFGYLKIEVFS
ncbi:hypothetical protein CL619_04330 [archaeon]|nr:hypothetical protein [archaeon]|tara:strand:- start:1722 stop:2336 length:615 start_codon:yes stop_codon:yes gene_type:complete